MKKRIVGTIMAIAMLAGIVPTFASATDYNITGIPKVGYTLYADCDADAGNIKWYSSATEESDSWTDLGYTGKSFEIGGEQYGKYLKYAVTTGGSSSGELVDDTYGMVYGTKKLFGGDGTKQLQAGEKVVWAYPDQLEDLTLQFDYKLGADADQDQLVVYLRAGQNDGTACWSGNKSYSVWLKNSCVELHVSADNRWVKNLVPAVQNGTDATWNKGGYNSCEIAIGDTSNGVNIIVKLNGQTIIDTTDTGSPQRTGAGYLCFQHPSVPVEFKPYSYVDESSKVVLGESIPVGYVGLQNSTTLTKAYALDANNHIQLSDDENTYIDLSGFDATRSDTYAVQVTPNSNGQLCNYISLDGIEAGKIYEMEMYVGLPSGAKAALLAENVGNVTYYSEDFKTQYLNMTEDNCLETDGFYRTGSGTLKVRFEAIDGGTAKVKLVTSGLLSSAVTIRGISLVDLTTNYDEANVEFDGTVGSGNTVKVRGVYANGTDDNVRVSPIVAFYSGNEVLVGVKALDEIGALAYTTENISANVTVPAGATYMKVFCWDGLSNLTPLTQAFSSR